MPREVQPEPMVLLHGQESYPAVLFTSTGDVATLVVGSETAGYLVQADDALSVIPAEDIGAASRVLISITRRLVDEQKRAGASAAEAFTAVLAASPHTGVRSGRVADALL